MVLMISVNYPLATTYSLLGTLTKLHLNWLARTRAAKGQLLLVVVFFASVSTQITIKLNTRLRYGCMPMSLFA